MIGLDKTSVNYSIFSHKEILQQKIKFSIHHFTANLEFFIQKILGLYNDII